MNRLGHPADRGLLLSTRRLAAKLSADQRVLLYAVVLAGLGVGLLSITPGVTTVPERAWSPPFLVLTVAFALAEGKALHIEIRKESHSLSLSGIPLMFGLLYLSPLHLVFAFLLGSAPAMLLIRRSDATKTTWNLCLFFAEAALASLVVRSLLGTALPEGFFEWMVPLLAVLAAELLSLIAVPLVIMTVDAKFRPALFSDAGQAQLLAALAGTFTVTAVSSSVRHPGLVLYAVIPLLGVGALLTNHGRLNQRYKDLLQLHRFTRALTHERGSRTLDTGLAELVEIMRSRTAGMMVTGCEDGERTTLRVHLEDVVQHLDPKPIEQALVNLTADGSVVVLSKRDSRPGVQAVLAYVGATEMLATSVLTEVDRTAVLYVADRLGMTREFNPDQARVFGSLAGNLSARVANDLLVEKLEDQALHDSLTGLPNRLSFELSLREALAQSGSSGVVVMIDLDRFKDINDSLGHEVGDQLLVEVAKRLKQGCRGDDVVGRFGGDEFAMMFKNPEHGAPVDFSARLDVLRSQLTNQMQLGEMTFEVGASLGVAPWPEAGLDSSLLLRRSDSAMYRAKREQRGVAWYAEHLDEEAPRRLELLAAVRAALEEEALEIHIQPKVSARHGVLTGAEALARWTHPELGPISPIEFVPLISQAGMSGKLTRFVIKQSMAAARRFNDAGVQVPIAVNLTARDLLDQSLPNDIAGMLVDAGVSATNLMVEVTENAMIVDFETSVSVLTRIRDMGVKVAIDDFGTGYSSLQHLHRLPVDELKIDRSFVMRLAVDDSAMAIVRASINLAHDLELATVAEGVEDEVALRLVNGLGCEEIQGYLVSRPLPADDFLQWALAWDDIRSAGSAFAPRIRAV